MLDDPLHRRPGTWIWQTYLSAPGPREETSTYHIAHNDRKAYCAQDSEDDLALRADYVCPHKKGDLYRVQCQRWMHCMSDGYTLTNDSCAPEYADHTDGLVPDIAATTNSQNRAKIYHICR
jgi:hypothetical protein